MPRTILVIEDDRDIAQLVALHLGDLGFEVRLTYGGAEGLRHAQARTFDLVVLDLILPEVEGLEICRQLRARPPYTPILMLTSRSSELDRVLGLELGADDYMTKPFSLREFLSRVKALFRRVDAFTALNDSVGQLVAAAAIRCGPFVIDREKREVTLGEKSVHLTAKEFDLLVQFAAHPGRVYSRSHLLDQVWGGGYEGYEHTVNSHINRLRAKIEQDPARPLYLQTVWGVGYKFVEPEGWKEK